MKQLYLPLVLLAALMPRMECYGSIRNTQDQLFGRKHADKILRLEREAENPSLVQAYSHLLRAILGEKSIRRELSTIWLSPKHRKKKMNTTQKISDPEENFFQSGNRLVSGGRVPDMVEHTLLQSLDPDPNGSAVASDEEFWN